MERGGASDVVPVLVVLCGLSFSGKSIIAEELAGRMSADRLGLDGINAERGLLIGQGVPPDEWVRTKEIAHRRARAALAAGRSVVVDDTSSPRFLRDEWRALADDAGASMVLVLVDLDPVEQRARIAATPASGDRPDDLDSILEEHRAGFETPTEDERAVRIDGKDSRSAAVLDDLARLVQSRIG